MNRNEFILQAFKESVAWKKAAWVFSLFTVVRDNQVENIPHPYPYQIGVLNGRYAAYIHDTWMPITDSPDHGRPLFHVEDTVYITSQDQLIQPCDTVPFKTRAGNLFMNYYLLVHAFGDRIPYQNGLLKISKLENMVKDKIIDPNYPNDPNRNLAVSEVKAFSAACMSVGGFSSINTPSATRYTMLPPPGIKELREQLLEKYKDKLHDPAVVAEIDKQLVAHDRAHHATDPDGGFLFKDKAFNISRKELYLMQGYKQNNMQLTPDMVTRSLSEGWDIDKMPTLINGLRDGSFNRGALTALGGEAVKFIFRIFATTRISEEDCGSKVGMFREVTSGDLLKTIIVNEKQILLTEENIKTYKGTMQVIRSPGYCKTGDANFCLKCMGLNYRGSENALAALASNVGSDMLNIFMSKMHGSQLVTTPWKYKETIS